MTGNVSLLEISGLQDGLGLLARVPADDPLVAEQQLLHILDSLLAAPPPRAVLLPLLERMRAPLAAIADEMVRGYQNSPLPLDEEADDLFGRVVRGWRKMAQAYALCEMPASDAEGRLSDPALAATILHRSLHYVGMVIFEHYRAHRELPAGIWLELHALYRNAESWGVAYTPVENGLETTLHATHCAAAYAAQLLIEIASPYSQSIRDLALIRRWAAMWAPLVAIRPLDDDSLPPYLVELNRDQPLHQSASAEEASDQETRQLDTSRLGLQIDHLLGQLRQRITPSQLGLGDETTGHVVRLLGHLARPWTQSALPRRFRRFPTSGIALSCSGFDSIYYHVSGEVFEQPDSADVYSRGEFNEIFTFREQIEPGLALNIRQHADYPVDEWAVINHSANGFRLVRGCAGQRVTHGELLALCPHDGERFRLVQVTWLMQEAAGGLVAGVAILPGMPVGVGVRPSTDVMASSERFVPAFLLPEVPAIREEASLVLPTGLYQASHRLDIRVGEDVRQVRMNHVLQLGSDFVRISYQSI